jgi:hypothetical protein
LLTAVARTFIDHLVRDLRASGVPPWRTFDSGAGEVNVRLYFISLRWEENASD